MNTYFKILDKYEKLNFQESETDLIDGEFKSYKYNIQQKISNDIRIKKIISNKEYTFSNFGFSENGNFLAFIHQDKFLVLYDEEKMSIVLSIQIHDEIRNSIHNYTGEEKRNLMKKAFSHLSFFELNIKTNNIYVGNTGECIIISSSKIHFQ